MVENKKDLKVVQRLMGHPIQELAGNNSLEDNRGNIVIKIHSNGHISAEV